MIEVYDDIVPFHVQQAVYGMIINSNFRLGWGDRSDISADKVNIYSGWSLDDLKRSGLYAYVEGIHSFEKYEKCVVNLTKPCDYHYKHTHLGQTLVLYYANLVWREGWDGETVIDGKVYEYTPGRLIKMDGHTVHSIKPQSIIGPNFRFTVAIFFGNEADTYGT
tara:strand:+ start:55 stop:546 length:492 start_codon:yes stop_codon:yes gene_type:complete